MIWTILAVVVILVVLAAAFLLRRKKGLSAGDKAQIQEYWRRACAQPDPHRRVLDADAVVSQLLKRLGYQGSVADQLKKAGTYIPDVNAVWAAHKLRNRIAHEPGAAVSPAEADRAIRAFERLVQKYAA
jgi:hypothetical protein